MPPKSDFHHEATAFAELVASGIDEAAARQVITLIDHNEYKRRQAAPGIKITSKAFGIGRRYPIVADYPSLHKTRLRLLRCSEALENE